MSKFYDAKPHNQRRPAWLLLILVISAVVIVAGAALLIVPKQQPSYIPEVVGKPNAVLDQDFFDFGDVPVNKTVTASFTIRNTGDEVLVIEGQPYVEVLEGCCPPQTSMSASVLYPGQESVIDIPFTMHPGMDGQHEFLVHVPTNDPENTDTQVRILSNWVA